MASLEGVWPPWRGRLIVCVDVFIVLLNPLTHSGSLASCLCEEEEVLDWFHNLNAMKYCKQFVEKVPRCDYTCVCAHAHTQHTRYHLDTSTTTHSHNLCDAPSVQGYNQLSDVARLDEEAIKQVVRSGGRIYCCWWWWE